MALKFNKTIERYITNVINDYKKGIREDLNKTANYTNDEMYKTAIEMYDTFIDQFYEYSTKAYIRHGESRPGTSQGINLYRAQDIKKTSGKNPTLSIYFSSADMEGGYQHGTPQDVLQNVMNGIRGVPPYWFVPWRGQYFGEHFSYSGDPIHAFDTFEDNFIDIARPIFMEYWGKLRKRRGW